MSKDDDGKELPIPPRVRVALDMLHHARELTDQYDASIPRRELTPLEKSVQTAALRVIQQYLLGEMDFAPAGANSLACSPVASGETAA